ncbi:MAG TPA: class I SAM-dependent methyltransferase [Candidatus Sulfomarinibacteraceae bacterium]|nr:class I SAM-dependent methyltransferase [Candidatus Sulfomarinibacteraceae bacterium]
MDSQELKQRVQQQFGDKAEAYANSRVHAHGPSLARLVDVVQPQADWIALDVATAAGHTAHAFAPHVRRIVASDLTSQMLPKARELAAQRGLGNLDFVAADAEQLPFPGATFNLITCRIAPHHFPSVEQFLSQAARVLRAGGLLIVVDNVAPGSRLRGKKGRLQREAGRYVNAFEKLRDPSHHRCLSVQEWRTAFYQAGFALQHEEIRRKEMDFAAYVARMNVPPADVLRLEAMLRQAPAEVLEFLTPVFGDATIKFHLSEALFVGRLHSEDR